MVEEKVTAMSLKNAELKIHEGKRVYLINKRSERGKQVVDIYPVVVDKIYHYCIIVVDSYGIKIGITRACAALDLKTYDQIIKMKKEGVVFS